MEDRKKTAIYISQAIQEILDRQEMVFPVFWKMRILLVGEMDERVFWLDKQGHLSYEKNLKATKKIYKTENESITGL